MSILLTIEQVAELLDCSRDTVTGRLARNELPGVKYGRSWRTPADPPPTRGERIVTAISIAACAACLVVTLTLAVRACGGAWNQPVALAGAARAAGAEGQGGAQWGRGVGAAVD